jgi:hypothetical protein
MINIEMLSHNNDPPDTKLISRIENTDTVKMFSKYIICPLRYFPIQLNNNYQYIILLRNPLDILVSEYYSFGWMHIIDQIALRERKEIQAMSIDEYCLSPKYQKNLYERYKPILNYINTQPNNLLVLQYADMVLNFGLWMYKLGNFLGLDNKNIELLIEKFNNEFIIDFKLLSHEDITQKGVRRHKRHLLPNDHLNKLKPETIAILNDYFGKIIHIAH